MTGDRYPGYVVLASSAIPPHWGVDSVTHADYLISGTTFFDLVTAQAGRKPEFWGRYIGSPTTGFNLTSSEAAYLLSRNCRILLIYNGESADTVRATGPQGQQNGVNAANRAIASAQALGVPADGTVWIYCDIEGDWFPSSDFFNGWFTTLLRLPSGYGPGVYGRPGSDDFNNQYCLAYNPNATPRELLYSTQPGACNWPSPTFRPPFNPTIIRCSGTPPKTPLTVVHQYAINCPVPGVQISFVQQASNSATGVPSGSAITVMLPSIPQNGNTLVAVIVSNAKTNQFSVSGGGAPWVPPPVPTVPPTPDPLSSNVNENTIIRRSNPVSNPVSGTITVSMTGSVSPADICVIVSEWNGLSADIDVTAPSSGSASPINTPAPPQNLTTQFLGSDLLISVGGGNGNMTPGAPGPGWTALAAPPPQAGASIVAAYRIVSGRGAYSNTWSYAGSSGWDGVIAAFKAQQVDLDMAEDIHGFPSMWKPTNPIYLVWRAGRVLVPGNIRDVFVASVSNDSGQTWSAPVNNPPGDNDYSTLLAGAQTYTVLSRGGGQSIDVYYVAGSGFPTSGRIRRVSFSNGAWLDPVSLYTPPQIIHAPYAFRSRDSSSRALCWRENVNNNDFQMYVDLDPSTGNFVGTPLAIAGPSSFSDPRGRYDSSGNPVVSWGEFTAGKRITRTGGVWGAVTSFDATSTTDFDAQRFLGPPGLVFVAQLTPDALVSKFRAIAKASQTITDLIFTFRKKPESSDVTLNLRTVAEPPDPILAVSMPQTTFYGMPLWENNSIVVWALVTARGAAGQPPTDIWVVLGQADGTDWHVKHVAQEAVSPNTSGDVWGVNPIDSTSGS